MRTLEVNTKNLRTLAWLNGFKGVAGLARSLGRDRATVYRTVRNPQQYRPTYRALQSALRIRSISQ